jgi:hypothetical protein
MKKLTVKAGQGFSTPRFQPFRNQSENNQHRLYAVRRFRLRSYTG